MASPKHRPIRQRALGRTGAAILVMSVVGFLLSLRLSPVVAILGGWDAGGITLLSLAWLLITSCDCDKTRSLAGPEDPGRRAIYAVVTFTNLISILAAIYLQRKAHLLANEFERTLLVVLCLTTVVLSWLITHTIYTLRYAHLYYREDDEGVGGVEMPGGEKPSYWDFAYFAFTLGICFQVSDMTITSSQIRRAALGHAMLSFAYNTFILAFTLNLVFSSFG